MMSALASLCAVLPLLSPRGQTDASSPVAQSAPAPSAVADRVVTLTLDTSAPRFTDIGPSATVVQPTFEPPGRLYVWALAEGADPVLVLEDAAGRELARDDDAGGKPVPWLAFDVLERRDLVVRVAVHDGATLPARVELHFVEAPERPDTRTPRREAAALVDSARKHAESGRFTPAFADLARARDLLAAVAPPDHSPAMSDAWRSVLGLAMEWNDIPTLLAASSWLLVRAERVDSPDHPDHLRALGFRARALYLAGDVSAALDAQQRAFASAQRTLPAADPLRVTCAQNLANLLCEVQRLDEATTLYQQALDALEAAGGGASLGAARLRLNLALTLDDRGDAQRARALLERVVADSAAPGSPSAELATQARLRLGSMLSLFQDHAAARVQLERAIADLESALPPDHPDLVQARASLASVEREQGDLGKARADCEELLELVLRRAPETHANVIDLRVCLGLTYRLLDDVSAARDQFERALAAIGARGPEHPQWFAASADLALTLQDVGNLVGARSILERVLAAALPKFGAGHPDVIGIRANLASVLRAQGELEASRDLCAKLLEDAAAIYPEDHPRRMTLLSNLANVSSEIELTPQTLGLSEQVLEARERVLGPDAIETVRARLNLGVLRTKKGDFAGAAPLLERCLETSERTLGDDHVDVLSARSAALSLASRTGDAERARALARDLARGVVSRSVRCAWLAPLEARTAVASLAEHAAQVVSALAGTDASDRRTVFEMLETLRAAGDLAARTARVVRGTPELARLADEASAARGRLADPRVREDAASLAQLALERDELERRLQKQLAERGAGFEPVRVAELAPELAEGECAVAFRRIAIWNYDSAAGTVKQEERLLAHVVKRDGALVRLDLGPASELDVAVAAWRGALGEAQSARGVGGTRAAAASDERALAAALRVRLLDPVFAAAGSTCRALRVCADDLVHLVPLDALPMGEGLVGDRARVRLASSLARAPRVARAESADTVLVAIGDVDFGAAPAAPGSASARGDAVPFAALPGTAAEVQTVASLCTSAAPLTAVVLARTEATKTALIARAPRARYLHLATHGWFAGDDTASVNRARGGAELALRADEVVTGLSPGLLCGLALAGANVPPDEAGRAPGILTAEELAGLDLSRCELAVLSACDTNAGTRRAGLGIQSLQSAVHAAGARTAITSLWRVDDAATRRLMERFYSLLWKEHLAPGEALWRAKLAARAANEPPAAWAGWVLSESGG